MAKEYTIVHKTSRSSYEFSGTIAELIEDFGYSLEVGHSWDSKIPLNPKTISSLVSALNKSAYVSRRYNETYYEKK